MKKKNYFNPFDLRFIFFLLIIFIFTAHTASLHEVKWQKAVFQEITIFYSSTDNATVDELQPILAEIYPYLKNEFLISDDFRLTIKIAPSSTSFHEYLGSGIPEWSEAVYISSQKSIILQSPTSMQLQRSFRATIIHEFVHAVLDHRVNYQPIPRWLNEGLAVLISGERDLASNSLITRAASTHSLIPLNEIDNVLNFQKDRARLAYQQSYLATQYLISNNGFSAVNSILDNLKQGLSQNQAFINSISINFHQFEREWREHIHHEKRWDLLFDLHSLLWPLMGILFLLVAAFVFYRNRKRLKEWEEDEF